MFSIIMPVWNRANYVRRAVQSVLAQTFRDYELVIIDDGSEDNLKEAVRSYLSDRIIYHRIPHSGLSAARNAGIRKSTFPFLAYLDSDNCWHPEFLASMHDALQSVDTPHEAAYCMANRYRKNPLTGEIVRDGTIGEPFSFKKLMDGNFIDINMLVHSRKVVEYAGMFDETLENTEDWDFILRVTSLFEPLFVPKVLVDYYLGIADNAISITADLKINYGIVRSRNIQFNEPITFVHDTIEYDWKNLREEKYYNWVRLHHKQLNTSDYTAWGYPFMLQIEPTNVCNLKCPLCPVALNELGRRPRHMKLEEFKGIIDDMERYLLFIVLWDWGEPFANPELPNMIRYASERDIQTVTSTNAQLLDNDAYLEAILTSGLSTLIVAIDSIEENNYPVYRQKGRLDKAISGLQKLVEMKKRLSSNTHINMRMVIMRHNEHELTKLRRLARKVGVDRFSVKAVTPSFGKVFLDSEFVPRKLKYRFFEYKPGTYERIRIDTLCRRPWEIASILSNGDVVPCCWDYDDSMKVGNVLEEPFTKIWNGPAYRELRKRIYHTRHTLPKCMLCPPNFKVSKGGWFPESLDLTDSALERFKRRLKRKLRGPLGRRIINIAKVVRPTTRKNDLVRLMKRFINVKP